jgi:hypothetical protein
MKGADKRGEESSSQVTRLKTEPGEQEGVGVKSTYVILIPHWTTLTAYLPVD